MNIFLLWVHVCQLRNIIRLWVHVCQLRKVFLDYASWTVFWLNRLVFLSDSSYMEELNLFSIFKQNNSKSLAIFTALNISSGFCTSI